MKTGRVRALLGAFLFVVLAGRAAADESVVTIHDNFFTPRNLSVAPGDTVTWTNAGSATHTATSISNLWDSGLMSQGDTFSFTFTNAGIFPYFCEVHGPSMSGTIRVGITSSTNDLFLLNLTGAFRSTNGAGAVVLTPKKTRDFVEDCAEEHSRDPAGLALVYDLQGDAMEVVDRTDGSVVCTLATLNGGVTIASANETQRERQAFVFWEDADEMNGSLAGTELSTRGPGGGLLKYTFRGSIQVGIDAHEGAPKVFQGNFSTGKRLALP